MVVPSGCMRPPIPSVAVNVGSRFSAVAIPSPLFAEAPFLFQLPHTVSVGSKAPPPIAAVACADIRRGKASVAPGVAPRRQRGQDDVPPSGADAGAVFEENESRSKSVNGAQDFDPEAAALAVDALTASSRRYILAREARCEAIHAAGPSSIVEGSHVAFVDVQAGKPAGGGMDAQPVAAGRVVFDGKDGGMSKYEVCK